MRELFINSLTLIATIISGISILIVVYGTVISFYQFIRNELKRHHQFMQTDLRRIRVECGSYLLLGLEFLIASDILETVVHPDLEELALLGGIVLVRIVLSYFLNLEIKELSQTPTKNAPSEFK